MNTSYILAQKFLIKATAILGFIALTSCTQADLSTDDVAVQDKKRPNIVWLVSEDNAKSYLSLYDEQGADMPNVQALAANGLVFNNAFSNAPVCSTARSTLATGAYATRLGLDYHRRYKEVSLPQDLKPISLYLKEAGYYTSNDVKTDFNFYYESLNDLWNNNAKGATWRDRAPNQPFFHMQSWTTTHEKTLHFPVSDVGTVATTHNPDTLTLPSIYPNTKEFRYTYARYLDNHVAVDKEIGEVVAKLKEDGLLEDTFIFYFGDHGGVMPASKGYAFERGLQVPLVVRIPKNFKHLVENNDQAIKATRINGFVSFIDFAPTIAHLAGLALSPQYDGKPFLGAQVNLADVEKRDTTFGYADRFDEKSDMVRTVRKGKYKYIRNFWPMNPDGLHSDYRYKQAAYKQWRDMFKANQLNEIQSAFFKRKAPEALYDLEKDPDETHNLAADSEYKSVVSAMRKTLNDKLTSLPDLGFYPESFLIKHALSNPVEFGQENRDDIQTLIAVADLQLAPYEVAKKGLVEAINSKNEWTRYWGLIGLSRFSDQATDMVEPVKQMLETENNKLIKARAIEFLTLSTNYDPSEVLSSLIDLSSDIIETLEIMNIACVLKDTKGYNFDLAMKDSWKKPGKNDPDLFRKRSQHNWLVGRMNYLAGAQ